VGKELGSKGETADDVGMKLQKSGFLGEEEVKLE